MNFFLGCAVWAYKGWLGDFYPQGSRAKDFLSLYSHRFHGVEGNTTFYAIPDQDTVKRWVNETPKDFRFCLKLPRDFTHNGLLQTSIADTWKFAERMQGLGDRLGAIFAQLPPNYSPALLDDLIVFLEAWQATQVPLALEVRHTDWFQEDIATNLNSILEQLQIGRVLLDSRPVYTGKDDPQLRSRMRQRSCPRSASASLRQQRRKPKLPLEFSITANFSIIRFISHPDRSVNQLFMAEWAKQIETWLKQEKTIYFFVHCPIEERSPFNARYFQALLEQQKIPIPPLPWNNLDFVPTQLNLW